MKQRPDKKNIVPMWACLIVVWALMSSLSIVPVAMAQEPEYHFTIPSTDNYIIDMGPVSWIGELWNFHLWITNPTDDTLRYQCTQPGFGFFYIRDSSNGIWITIGPHETKRCMWIFQTILGGLPSLFDQIVLSAYKLTDDIANDVASYRQTIQLHGTDDYSPFERCPLRANQYIMYPVLNGEEPDTIVPFVKTFFNSSDTEVTVYSAFVTEFSPFTIIDVQPHGFPVVLKANEEISVALHFDGRLLNRWPDPFVVITDPSYNLRGSMYRDTLAKPTVFHDEVNISTSESIITIYPNPASSFLRVTGTRTTKNIKVYDLIGRRCEVTPGRESASSATIDISSLQPGIYSLRMDDRFLKFVVRR